MIGRDKVISILKEDEGFKRSAYLCSEGWLTIGYGRLIDERKGGGLDEDEAEYLLRNDVNRITKRLSQEPWWALLAEERRAVMVMMAFQMGISGLFSFKRMISAINRRDYGAAAAEMLDSQWARQTPARARRLSIQMDSGNWHHR